MDNHHIIPVTYSGSGSYRTRAVYQYDYGQILSFDGFDLPDAFEVHFYTGGGESVTVIGHDDQVAIPDSLLQIQRTVTVWLFLHDTEDDGETRFVIEIPVRGRSAITDEEPTPEEQSVITQAIAALQTAVTKTEAAQDAAETAQEAAEAAQTGAEAAQSAAEAARDTAVSAATSAASSASASGQSAATATERAAEAVEAARSATGSASSAAQSATTATEQASTASGSASAAAQSANSAATSATNAASSASAAAQSATAAGQSKSTAESAAIAATAAMEASEAAQTAAEAAASSASGSATAASSSAEAASGSADAAAESARQAAETVEEISGVVQDVSDLKSAIEATTGNEQIQFSDPALKQYILLSGNTVSFTPYTATVANVKYAIVDCSEGDKFTINGTGGGGDRLWAFVDANKNVLVKSNANVTAIDLLLIAPANATNLIINDETDKESYIGELAKNRIGEIENTIDEITEYSSLVPYATASGLLMTDGTITAGNYVINKYRDITGKNVYINGEGGFNPGNNFCYVWFVKNGVMVSNIPVTIKPQTFNHYAVFVDDTFDEIWINRSVSIDLMERIAIDSYARKIFVDIIGAQWRGKKWYAYGTSMTSVHQGTGKYPTFVQQFSGMVLTEKGIGGGAICNNTQIKDAVMNITDGKLEADLITLEIGANDTTAPIGTIYDTGNDTFCGALNQCIRYLQANTTAQIVVISSTNARKNSGGASASPEVTYGTDNHTKYDQWKATREVCEINSCYYIPMGENANMSWARMNASNDYNTDDIHHTDLGGYNLAMFVWYCLRNIPLWFTAIPS